MKRLLAAIFMLGGLTILPHYASAQPADSKAEIEQVVEIFRTAIINKDEETFLKLFLKEDITGWCHDRCEYRKAVRKPAQTRNEAAFQVLYKQPA